MSNMWNSPINLSLKGMKIRFNLEFCLSECQKVVLIFQTQTSLVKPVFKNCLSKWVHPTMHSDQQQAFCKNKWVSRVQRPRFLLSGHQEEEIKGLLGHYSEELQFSNRCSSWSAPWADFMKKARRSQGHNAERLAAKELWSCYLPTFIYYARRRIGAFVESAYIKNKTWSE